jgi:hypothetical protein
MYMNCVWTEVLKHLELRRFTPPITLGYEPGVLSVTATWIDQDSQELAPRSFTARYQVPPVRTVPEAVNWIRHQLLNVYLSHELDEAIHFDGIRIFDPHRGYPRPACSPNLQKER